MTLYRLFTQDSPNLPELVSRLFPGFSILSSLGYWKGVSESSVCIEILTDDADSISILATDIKVANQQESILVQRLAIEGSFV